MLREAQAGDVLIAGAIDGMFYTFEGQDTTVLDGIYWSDPYGNAITKKHHHPNQAGYSLGDIYNFSGYADASWDGFIRWNDGLPSFYVRSDSDFRQRTTPDWVRTGLSYSWNAVGFFGGLAIPGGNVAKAIGLTGVFATPHIDSLWLDMNAMQSGDVQVFIGNHRLIFYNGSHQNGYQLRSASWTGISQMGVPIGRSRYWSE